MKRAERAALDAVAAHCSTTWKESASGPTLMLGGKRIALAVVAVKPQVPAKQHLRFDKVALELMERLQAGLADSVPAGKTIVLTCTAPIRQSGKTAAELAEKVKGALARNSRTLDIKDTIQGNRVRARQVKGGNPKVIGFVHNPDPKSDVLLDLTQALLAQISAREKTRARSDRWLVIADDGPHIEAYRHIASQLAGFKTVLLVRESGRIETLSG
ncbi:MAG TPA: hypothetical protein VMU22_11490 [Rhizomicrobium sp.]|nr:hypothetical protein [Rhizomicrobium sp.]